MTVQCACLYIHKCNLFNCSFMNRATKNIVRYEKAKKREEGNSLGGEKNFCFLLFFSLDKHFCLLRGGFYVSRLLISSRGDVIFMIIIPGERKT